MSPVELLTFSMRTAPPKDDADWFRIVDKKGEKTKVYIYDEIGFWGTTAKDFAAQLNEIDANEIELHLNSPGGSVFDGLAIMATLKSHKAKIIGIVDGMAASAASFILQAADERHITRNAQVMIHDAKAYAGGNAEQMRKAADLLDRVSDNIADIYAVRSGQGTVESWREIMKSGDMWYSGNEALDAGLVDTVLDNPEEDDDGPEEATKNSWTAAEVEAFLNMPPEKLAANANQLTIKNRVEEAPMSGGNPENKNTPPTPPTPPAQPTATGQAATVTLVVNGAEVTDLAAVQAHITSLESFKSTTIKTTRENFVKGLSAGPSPKIAATQIDSLIEFADSLTDEQFDKWKASMDAAPASTLLSPQGGTSTATEQPGPVATGDKEKADRIAVLQGIIDSHRAMNMSEEVIKAKPSYKELQNLLNSTQTA